MAHLLRVLTLASVIVLFVHANGNAADLVQLTVRADDPDPPECEPCKPGRHSPDVENCTICESPGKCVPGYCEPCPAGHFAPGNGTVNCTACSAGQHAPERGSAKCYNCTAGTFSRKGQANCVPCGKGFFSDTPGSTKCEQCHAGSFSDIPGSQACQLCPTGTFADRRGLTTCIDCGPGFYNGETGATSESSCLACPAGHYCPTAKNAEAIPCPANSKCPAGAGDYVACPVLYGNEGSSEKCYPSPWLFVVVGVATLTGLTAVVAIVRSRRLPAPPARDSYRTIPEPKSGPVYQGY